MFFIKSKPNLPARLPPGLPANFKGVPKGGEQLTEHIARAGGVPFDHLAEGVGAMRSGVLNRLKGVWRHWFFLFDSYDAPGKANKFTLAGAANFTGEYPQDLVAARKK